MSYNHAIEKKIVATASLITGLFSPLHVNADVYELNEPENEIKKILPDYNIVTKMEYTDLMKINKE